MIEALRKTSRNRDGSAMFSCYGSVHNGSKLENSCPLSLSLSDIRAHEAGTQESVMGDIHCVCTFRVIHSVCNMVFSPGLCQFTSTAH